MFAFKWVRKFVNSDYLDGLESAPLISGLAVLK